MRREYLPELARVRAQREATLQKQKEDSTERMMTDLAVDRARNPKIGLQDRWNPHDDEEEEEDDGGELNIIDRSAFHILSSAAIVLFRPHSASCYGPRFLPEESPAACYMTRVRRA
jgi:hypothetical protein